MHYGPPDASKSPRYTGLRTYARCPAATDWDNSDVAVIGVPFDTATSFRSGPRFGPAAIREASLLLRPWHPALGVDVFGTLSVVDGGDLDVTPFRRALEEGLIDPARSLLAGLRGSLYAASDLDEPRSWGFEIVPCDELRTWTPQQYGERVRARIGDGPVYLSFDIDVLDPAFAPGTGTPEVAGLLPHEAIAFLRALAGLKFSGFDVVEVSPPYDTAGATTALTAASIAYE